MTTARIDSSGRISKLDPKTQPDEQVTADDVNDSTKLARLLTKILASIASLVRRRDAQVVYFEDRAVTSGTLVNFVHNMGARVYFTIVDWSSSSSTGPAFRKDASTTSNVLVLNPSVTGTVSVRIEKAG